MRADRARGPLLGGDTLGTADLEDAEGRMHGVRGQHSWRRKLEDSNLESGWGMELSYRHVGSSSCGSQVGCGAGGALTSRAGPPPEGR